MNRNVRWLTGGFLMLLICLCSCNSASRHDKEWAERFNHRAFDLRYTNLDSVDIYARKALDMAKGSPTDVSEAYNNMALGALMKQDFPSAERYYELSMSSSSNQLEHLISDVGMMRVCQRTASNKRFYDYYNKAARSIKRLREEIDALDAHDRGRLNIAESDFHLAASTYFYYMQQEDRAREELLKLNLNEVAQSDSVQWVYGKYVWGTSGLNQIEAKEQSVIEEFDELLNALFASRMLGTIYLEANIIQTFSELLADSTWSQIVNRERHSELAFVNTQEVPDSLLPTQLSINALKMFQKYGDHYQVAGAYRSLSELLFQRGLYPEALEQLQKAVDEVNAFNRKFYPELASKCELSLYNETDSISVEMMMLDLYPWMLVPQWLANIRESISLAYSALDDKIKSDYNRNIYLDILDRTRQDKELESRYEQLESESYFMGVLLVVVLAIVVLGTIGFVYLNRIWSRKNESSIERLKRVAQICNKISSGLQDNKEDLLAQIDQLKQEDASLEGIIRPFQEWSEQYSATLSDLEEAHAMLEKEKYLHEQHVSDYKRQNLDKRTCMSIVYGITPFLDRMINEVRKLKSDDPKEIRFQRYTYIRELVDRINEYNDILALWIKMKQGTLSLHIENFALQELLDTISKGHRTFEQKNIELNVLPTTASVKADKPLTLFIINTLAENARKYTPSGGRVSIWAEQTDDYVEISVCDTGCGLSEADVKRILEEKVYDSSQIGIQEDNHKANEELRKNKGFGFGLMNCKGIIDKYRKTNSIFKVCLFGVESQLGKGSRFYFRLPNGVVRCLLLFMMGLHSLLGWTAPTQPDEWLNAASVFADSTYYANLDSDYDRALAYADSACMYLNRCYQWLYPESKRLMSMSDEDGLAELDWWRDNVGIDYHIILDIRNEAAVASLATKQWARYRLNNKGYTRLYKLLGEDSTLETYCQSMQRSASNSALAIWLIVILVLLFLILYYLLYFRHAQIYRMNMEQALMANQKILNLNSLDDVSKVLFEIYPDLNEIHPIKGLALLVNDGEKKHYAPVATQSSLLTPLLESQLNKVSETLLPIVDSQNSTRIVPLHVDLGNEVYGVGAFAFIEPASAYSPQDELLSDLILRYLAIMIYQTLIRLTLKQNDVELAEDEKRRTIYEENQLHVQNQMLDNCLSALKHETMYYPNRIRQMADNLMSEKNEMDENEQINAMRELMDYYKEVFTLLSSCASRQVVNVKLARSRFQVASLFQYMERFFIKKIRKSGLSLTLTTRVDDNCMVLGDEHLLRFMLENLVDAALQNNIQPQEAELTMSARTEKDEVRFEFTDPRGTYTQEYLNSIFYPDLNRMRTDETGSLKGIQYLVARQIIRDHEELYNHRGCRINAEVGPDGKGFVLWFTLRVK